MQGFPGGSGGEESACNSRDPASIPGLGRSPGEENGHPLQCSWLENSMMTLLSDITGLFSIAAVDGKIVQDALSSNFTDFEDAVQCYTAVACCADVIVTRNAKDFGLSPLLVKTPKEICELLQGYNFNTGAPSLLNEPSVPYGSDV